MFTFNIHPKAFAGQQTVTDVRNTSNHGQPAHLLRAAWIRALVVLPLALIALWQPVSVSAAPVQEGNTCVLACNAKTRRCSRFPSNKIPRGYRAQNGVPPGYKLIKGNTTCDSKMCTSKSKSICSASPIGMVSTSSEQ